MDDFSSHRDGQRQGWRTKREQRRLDKRALRSEFELDPRPRGFARLRALMADIGELERARIASHTEAANLRGRVPEPAAKRARRASR
ncbi:MAG: hypothetical protein M3071_06705 [Actinomycetota bacterium]|nr:hypothetical protein [Actinomycetota bacterium]